MSLSSSRLGHRVAFTFPTLRCPKVIEATDGCYVLEAKYSADYMRLHGGTGRLWSLSLIVGAVDTASRVHEAHYESEFVPFALLTRRDYTYYVTSTFTGDEFIPRIVELNAAGERIREIKPAKSTKELDACPPAGRKIGDPPSKPPPFSTSAGSTRPLALRRTRRTPLTMPLQCRPGRAI